MKSSGMVLLYQCPQEEKVGHVAVPAVCTLHPLEGCKAVGPRYSQLTPCAMCKQRPTWQVWPG